MDSRVLQIILYIAAVFSHSCECQSVRDGITISLGDRVIPNHGLVTAEDIRLDDTGSDLTVGLNCSTTYTDCCTSSTSTAHWYFAHVNMEVPQTRPDGPNSFETKRSGHAVYLFRNKVSTANGIMRCEIPDSNGHLQTKYVGVYKRGKTGVLSAAPHSTIQFTMVTEDPVVFNLTFRTTGGPATYVTWTRDGVNISSLGDNHYTPSQTVLPDTGSTEIYTAGDYDNILTVSGRLSGVYGVSVTNDRTTTPVTATRNILGDGIIISLGDRVIPNHGLVTTEDIGLDDTGADLTVGLNCSTTYADCCTSSTSTARWYFAHVNNVEVPQTRSGGDNSFEVKRSGQAVYLFRNKVSTAMGIMRCEIPDSSGHLRTKYVGVYNRGTTGTLSAGSPSTIQFTMVSEDPVIFNLTFKTTGGPATYVTWTRDGVNISSLRDNRYTPSQTVVPNSGVYTTGNYDNMLTVCGRLSGVYGVSVTNDRTTTLVTPRYITIIDFAHPNISLNVTRSQDLATILTSWTLVNPLSAAQFISYDLNYQVCGFWSGECDTVQTVVIDDFATTQYVVTGLTLWANYNFNVSAQSVNNEFTYILQTPKASCTITIIGILRPQITSVSELASITSVQVTWNQPEGGLAAGEYDVSYRRLNGRDEQCSWLVIQDEDSVTLTENEVNLNGLQPHSVYVVEVTGRTGSLYNTSLPFRFNTNSTVPSGAPQNLAVIDSTSTSVTISWDSVECNHRNGPITHYVISYGLEIPDQDTIYSKITVNNDGQENSLSYTISGLDPSSTFVFKVAAMNDAGVGIDATTHGKTLSTLPQKFQLKLERTDDCITWNADKAEEIRTNIRTRLFQVIQERCQCELQEENLLKGVFSCVHSHNQTTYRSSIIGTHSYYDTELVGFIQDWVNSGPTMTIQWYSVKVIPDCSVGIASLDEPECGESTTNGLIECPYDQDDPDIAHCVAVCIARSP